VGNNGLLEYIQTTFGISCQECPLLFQNHIQLQYFQSKGENKDKIFQLLLFDVFVKLL